MTEKGVEGKTISYLAVGAHKTVGDTESYSVCCPGGLGKVWPLLSDFLV